MKLLSLKGVRKASNKIRLTLAESLIFLVAGRKSVQSFRKGVFRDSGEIHRVMYDRYSLKRLLVNHGFVGITICQPTESRIPDYEQYYLDTFADKIRKPDSLFVEALKD